MEKYQWKNTWSLQLDVGVTSMRGKLIQFLLNSSTFCINWINMRFLTVSLVYFLACYVSANPQIPQLSFSALSVVKFPVSLSYFNSSRYRILNFNFSNFKIQTISFYYWLNLLVCWVYSLIFIQFLSAPFNNSISKNGIRPTPFLVYFKLDFYCPCSLQNSSLK